MADGTPHAVSQKLKQAMETLAEVQDAQVADSDAAGDSTTVLRRPDSAGDVVVSAEDDGGVEQQTEDASDDSDSDSQSAEAMSMPPGR